MNSTNAGDSSQLTWESFSAFLIASTPVLVAAFAFFLAIVVRRELPRVLKELFSVIATVVGSLVGVNPSAVEDGHTRRIDELISLLEARVNSPGIISPEAERRIVELFEDAIGSGINEEIKLALHSLVEKQVKDEVRLRSLSELSNVERRLQQASTTASIRGFFNLAIGIGFAIFALLMLKSAVELIGVQELSGLTISQALYMTGTRISLALVITLIAYFFLSLYKKSLDDVKYYQNEMTFIGLSYTAVGVAYDCEGDDTKRAIAQSMLERDNANGARDTTVTTDHTGLIGRLLEKLVDKIPAAR